MTERNIGRSLSKVSTYVFEFSASHFRPHIVASSPLPADHERASEAADDMAATQEGHYWSTASVQHAYGLARRVTMVPFENAKFVYRSLHELAEVPGAIVEVGVWKGGMAMLMALAELRTVNDTQRSVHRQVWLFDTFQGLPPPTSEDPARVHRIYASIAAGNMSDPELRERVHRGLVQDGKWNLGTQEEVEHTMRRSGYPASHVHLVKGRVETTLRDAANLPAKIALLRLDTDWYASTVAELDVLWPRVSPGGLMIVDDYFQWSGARRAVDEWIRREKITTAVLNDHERGVHVWKPRW